MRVSPKVRITKFRARDTVTENEHPYRTCKDAFFVHIWPRTMLVLGKWEETGISEETEEELTHLYSTVIGEKLGDWSPGSETATQEA